MFSDPEACRNIAHFLKKSVSWMSHVHEHEDGSGGLTVTVYSDKKHVQEVLGMDECFISLGAVVRVDIAFEKGERPPETRKLYALSPRVILQNPDRQGNSWSGVDLGSIAEHLGMKEDELHEILSPGVKVFRSEYLGAIAQMYAKYLVEVEENLAAIILSRYLSKGPAR